MNREDEKITDNTKLYTGKPVENSVKIRKKSIQKVVDFSILPAYNRDSS